MYTLVQVYYNTFQDNYHATIKLNILKDIINLLNKLNCF